VADLIKELSKRHRIQEECMNGALKLDKAYIPTRYPNAHASGSPRTRYAAQEARWLIVRARRSSSSVCVSYPRFDKKEIIQILSRRLKALQEKLPLFHVELFGSHAKGNYTVASDVDIMVIADFKERFLDRLNLLMGLNDEIKLPP